MFFKKAKRIKELEDKNFELDRALFEMTSFEKIAADKVTLWVGKHDELLGKYKELKKKYGEE